MPQLAKRIVKLRVLVACEWSCRVRDEFLTLGHDAWSCDYRYPRTGNKDWDRHLRQDVRPLLRDKWDLVIAHPPCTYLCNSGVWCLKTQPERWCLMEDAARFFLECYNANSPCVCVENPTMHGYARKIIDVPPTQAVQPYQFGDPRTKRTCLWLRGLPLLRPTRVLTGCNTSLTDGTSLPRYRAILRSITPLGIAQAMAEQWGGNATTC